MLILPQPLYEEVLAQCRRHYPLEACGLLAGVTGTLDRMERPVAQIYPMRNIEESPIGYAMDPKEQLLVERAMRRLRQHLIGIYHSHTATDAYPSSVDVHLAISPDLSYVLVSLKDPSRPVIRSYRIDGMRVKSEPPVRIGEGDS